jgi:transcriptional regulator with XRE-family HTH domain
MEDICARVGFNIRKIREEKKLTQEQLAGLADLHRAYMGQIERGEKNIGLRNLEKIAKALDVRITLIRIATYK